MRPGESNPKKSVRQILSPGGYSSTGQDADFSFCDTAAGNARLEQRRFFFKFFGQRGTTGAIRTGQVIELAVEF